MFYTAPQVQVAVNIAQRRLTHFFRGSAVPAVKCSMMAANISGFSRDQAYWSDFVTVMKSEPKKTPVTPSTWKSFNAKGDFIASRALLKLALPVCTKKMVMALIGWSQHNNAQMQVIRIQTSIAIYTTCIDTYRALHC
jgi:hypothetical protein